MQHFILYLILHFSGENYFHMPIMNICLKSICTVNCLLMRKWLRFKCHKFRKKKNTTEKNLFKVFNNAVMDKVYWRCLSNDTNHT